MIRSIATSYLALGVTLWILPGVQASGPASVVMLAIVVLAVGAALRWILLSLSVILGALALLVAGILFQAVILGIALTLTPGFQADSFADIVVASWSAAIVAALFNWLFDAGSEEMFHAHVLGRVVRVAGVYGEQTDQKGMLIIQLDGVSAPPLATGNHRRRDADRLEMVALGRLQTSRMAHGFAGHDSGRSRGASPW